MLVNLRESGPTFAAVGSVVALVSVVLLLFADEQFIASVDASRGT